MATVPARAPSPAPFRLVLPLATRWRVFGLLIPLVGLIMPVYLGAGLLNGTAPSDPGTLPWILWFFLLLFDLFVLIYLGLVQTRLVLTEAGIEYRALGYTVRSAWANV